MPPSRQGLFSYLNQSPPLVDRKEEAQREAGTALRSHSKAQQKWTHRRERTPSPRLLSHATSHSRDIFPNPKSCTPHPHHPLGTARDW